VTALPDVLVADGVGVSVVVSEAQPARPRTIVAAISERSIGPPEILRLRII
jgi:hypothetical protein